MRHLVLDGNPIDDGGLGHLSVAFLRSRSVETVSLRRCGLGEGSASLLLRLHQEKPGLEIDCIEGNPLGEEAQSKASAISRSLPAQIIA